MPGWRLIMVRSISRQSLLLAVAVTCGTAGFFLRAAVAAVPATETLSYAGLIADSAGVPLADGMHMIRVNVYDAATAGNRLCQSPEGGVPVREGRFRVTLQDCVATVAMRADLWAEVTVAGDAIGSRSKIGAVPYALEATHATSADLAAAVANGAVGRAQLANGAVDGARIAANVQLAGDVSVAGSLAGNPVLGVSIRQVTSCTNLGPIGPTDCACAANEVAIGGGAYAMSALLDESRPSDARTWRVGCTQLTNGMGSRILCRDPLAICMRVRP
jgi:hypothetical protein